LHNTYGFYALYANIDNFRNDHAEIPVKQRTELDQWILSKLNSLSKLVEEAMDDYEPTKATRAIQSFVINDLSNWYVRLNRRRFWKGELTTDKIAAYQTLNSCLINVAKLMCSFSPFYADRLYRDLTFTDESIHLQDFPIADNNLINSELESQIAISQDITSLILRIRKAEGIKVRQPLSKAIIPALNDAFGDQLKRVEQLIKSEVNIKEIEIIDKDSSIIKKSAKPNFKSLGKRVGKDMKAVSSHIFNFTDDDISKLERNEIVHITVEDRNYEIVLEDIEIKTTDIPGWQIINDNNYTVALDLELTAELKNEGIAREFVNKVQNLRKEKDFQVTDKITVSISNDSYVKGAIESHNEYICGEILAKEIIMSDDINTTDKVDIDSNLIQIKLTK
jgi:isoleucyl-tRNA synthetase